MNIFIAGLNYNMSEAELGELFAEYGEVVSVKIIMDRETGRSKGYGFVEMADDEAGDKAIAALNEVDMDGKTLSVTNNGKNAVTNLTLLAVGLNSKGEINRVIGIHTDDFGTKTIKPGKTYSVKVGGKGTNWQEFFGTNGKPNRIYIENADTIKIAY